MMALGALVVLALVTATQSEGGREYLRRALQAQLARSLDGTVHLGTLSGSFLTDLRTDSLEIRDRDDSVFVATGPIRLTFDPRDLADGRIIIRSAEFTRPFFAMRREHDGRWSHDKLWPERGAKGPRRARTAFGSVVVLEEARVEDGKFVLMLSRTADEHARGRHVHTWTWSEIGLDLPRVRLTYPDSAGRFFKIRRLDVVESNPPFTFSNLTGEVRWLGDSVWFDVPSFELPASTGRGSGKIVWGSDLPIRYRAHVVSDSVSLSDVAWIDESIPTTGGGRMVLDIANNSADLDVLEYAITSMDVRSHRSRLRGQMTWGVGGPMTTLRDVDIEATPLDFDLLRRFNQGPFPYPFNGRFTGRVSARGGPLDRFVIDDLTTEFRDANVPGAVARGSARGEVDIASPANTVFRGVDLTLGAFDLRTAQSLNPEFPRLDGVIAGTARLDSLWLDVRVSGADITHRDGDSPVSVVRGSGRLTALGERVAWELDAAMMPLSFTALARSYPVVPLRGDFSGPLRTRGTLAEMGLVADLSGDAGRIEADMRLDAEQPGYRVTGRANLSAFDPSRALDDTRAPDGELNARLAMDIALDSLADLRGEASVNIDRSLLDGVRVFAGTTRLRFAEGTAVVDTAHLETSALVLSSRGALGLHAGRDDSLRVRATVDSLGGLRRWLARGTSDSLAGFVQVDAVANGWVRDFAVGAAARGDGLLWSGNTARAVQGQAELENLPSAPVGILGLVADTVGVGGAGFTQVSARATLDGTGGAQVTAAGTGARGTITRADARIVRDADTIRMRLDTLSVRTALSRWQLAAPTMFAAVDGGFSLDSLLLRSDSGASLLFGGTAPRLATLDLRARTRALPVADIAEVLQLDGAAEGVLDLDARATGTRAAPVAELRAELRDGLVRGVRLDTLRLTAATAGADRLGLSATLGSQAAPQLVTRGTLPFRLGLDGASTGFLADGPLTATVRADSLPLALFEALTGGPNGYRGQLAANLDVSGTWRRPAIHGDLRLRDGQFALAELGNARWRAVQADIKFVGDSIAVDSVTAMSVRDGRTGRAAIAGWMKLLDRNNPLLDFTFRSREFHAFARPDVADIDFSGELRLDGAWRDARLRGMLTADRAIISIPELARKDVIALDGLDRLGLVDTLSSLDQRRLPSGPRTLVENLTIANVPVTMGRDVWLRSSEANINLGGFVSITQTRATRGRNAGELQLALDGPLQTVRGTYRLNLGPVQRTFEVQSGEIRFFGEAELNPTLDIDAVHTVRQYSQQGSRPDLRVGVHIGGTLLAPTAELSTPDSARVSNADLISYLVTGGPSYGIGGGDADYTSTAARVLISSVASVIGGKATSAGVCDDAVVSTSGLDSYGTGTRDVGGILAGTRFSCARQVGERAFVRLDAGLCQVGQLVTQGGNANPLSLDAIGVKLDYILSQGLTASVGIEPPTRLVLCAANASARGFVPTPKQIGFDLFRSWRF